VRSENVRALRLNLPEGPAAPLTVQIDGQELTARPWVSAAGAVNVYLEKTRQGWASVLPQRIATDRQRRPQKVSGQQGPIDDAFMAPFLCVRGTGKPWHDATQKAANDRLERFASDWAKYWRGTLPSRTTWT